MRRVPIGISDFKKLRDGDYYYADKSSLIDTILMEEMEVALFTRPRRFGKTLNLSMLDAYLNRDYLGNTWFDGLRISDIRPKDPDKNANVDRPRDMNRTCICANQSLNIMILSNVSV